MELTAEAMEAISDFYAQLRENNENLRLPITVRTLEGIIRLSTAAAKARMSEEGVEEVQLQPIFTMRAARASAVQHIGQSLTVSVSKASPLPTPFCVLALGQREAWDNHKISVLSAKRRIVFFPCLFEALEAEVQVSSCINRVRA